MKSKFWVTFEAEYSAGGTAVTKVKAVNMTQAPPQNSKGIPIAFEVELPEELFLGRAITVSVDVAPPPTPPIAAAVGSRWEEATKRHGAT